MYQIYNISIGNESKGKNKLRGNFQNNLEMDNNRVFLHKNDNHKYFIHDKKKYEQLF